MLYQVNILIAQ